MLFFDGLRLVRSHPAVRSHPTWRYLWKFEIKQSFVTWNYTKLSPPMKPYVHDATVAATYRFYVPMIEDGLIIIKWIKSDYWNILCTAMRSEKFIGTARMVSIYGSTHDVILKYVERNSSGKKSRRLGG